MKKLDYYAHVTSLLHKNLKKEAAKMLWPWLSQNEPMIRIWDAIEKYPNVAIMGHGSAGKTFNSCAWFLLDWWTNPQETAFCLTSATVDSLKARAWTDIKQLNDRTRVKMPGTLVDSERMIRYSPLDQKNAVAAIAGERKDAQAKIQGLHTKRIRVLIDEADNRHSQSIWSALSNLRTSGDLKVVALANPIDKFSLFGQKCEPENGWASINADSDFEWMSKQGWYVLRLDGLQSPNIKAGTDVYPFLLTNKAVKEALEKDGVKSREWWTYIRAFYPPEGTISSIFTGDIIQKAKTNLIVWYADIEPIASCDPAFEGGDHCRLHLGFRGRTAKDPRKIAIKVDKYITILRKNEKVPITIDYGEQIIELLKQNNVKPENFIIDSTGVGLGLSDYIKFAWDPAIVAVNFGGSPTDMTITTEDSKRASDRFDRFVSELWFVAREWSKLGLVQLSSPPRELEVDLESRTYDLLPSNKIRIEPKKKMKERGLHSPDHGDAFCLLVHLTRIRSQGFMPSLSTRSGEVTRDPLKKLRRYESVWEVSYGQPPQDH